MKTCVFYTFNGINQNVIYFIENGIFYSEEIKFVIICDHDIECIKYPKIPFFVDVLKRSYGLNYFDSWFQGLEYVNVSLFDYFLFICDSVIGPFYPNYYKEPWTNIFTSCIDKNVKFFGSYIFVDPDFNPIVSSNIFCMDLIGVRICCREKIFYSNSTEPFDQRQNRMSKEILKNNYNFGCLLRSYNNIDFRIKNSYPLLNNFMESDKLITMNVTPYELVFVETNKNMHHLYYTNYFKSKRCILFNNDVKIIKAKYGVMNNFCDVTTIVLKCVKENKPIIVCNDFFGHDPCPMVIKNCIIYYLKENNYKRFIFEEKSKIY